MSRSSEELSQPWGKMMCLGLGLLFMGKQLATEATLEVSTQHSGMSHTCMSHTAKAC